VANVGNGNGRISITALKSWLELLAILIAAAAGVYAIRATTFELSAQLRILTSTLGEFKANMERVMNDHEQRIRKSEFDIHEHHLLLRPRLQHEGGE
jgi:hypothetical protein